MTIFQFFVAKNLKTQPLKWCILTIVRVNYRFKIFVYNTLQLIVNICCCTYYLRHRFLCNAVYV